MPAFVMLTRLSGSAIGSPNSLEELEKKAMERISSECPGVKWIHNLAILGPYDYLDIFSAPTADEAFKVATLIRTFGHAPTEVWTATEWASYKDMVRALPGGKQYIRFSFPGRSRSNPEQVAQKPVAVTREWEFRRISQTSPSLPG